MFAHIAAAFAALMLLANLSWAQQHRYHPNNKYQVEEIEKRIAGESKELQTRLRLSPNPLFCLDARDDYRRLGLGNLNHASVDFFVCYDGNLDPVYFRTFMREYCRTLREKKVKKEDYAPSKQETLKRMCTPPPWKD